MTTKKQPTNLDLMKKLESFDARLVVVEDRWKEVDITKRAILEYQKEHPPDEKGSPNSNAWKAVIAALIAVTAAVLAK